MWTEKVLNNKKQLFIAITRDCQGELRVFPSRLRTLHLYFF